MDPRTVTIKVINRCTRMKVHVAVFTNCWSRSEDVTVGTHRAEERRWAYGTPTCGPPTMMVYWNDKTTGVVDHAYAHCTLPKDEDSTRWVTIEGTSVADCKIAISSVPPRLQGRSLPNRRRRDPKS